MSFDFSKLSGRIVEKFGTQYNFSIAMGMSERTLSLKLNNKVSWKTAEVGEACELLDIPREEIPEYFFDVKVQ
ncbi:DUF739 family protein [Aerococcaceae bacterium NML191219]|nr:DUF739 family protein [Aerococcaceae bacterium NML191219]